MAVDVDSCISHVGSRHRILFSLHTHTNTLLTAPFNPERDAGLAVIYIIVLIRPVHSAALSAKPVIVWTGLIEAATSAVTPLDGIVHFAVAARQSSGRSHLCAGRHLVVLSAAAALLFSRVTDSRANMTHFFSAMLSRRLLSCCKNTRICIYSMITVQNIDFCFFLPTPLTFLTG